MSDRRGRVAGVIFDADGVIQSLPADWADRLAAVLGVRMADLQELFEAERGALVGSVRLADALGPVLAAMGKQALLDEALAFWCRADVDHDVLRAVTRLRGSGARCYLATNQPDTRAAFMQKTLGYERLFDAEFYSCDLGCAKPERDFFECVLERVDVAGPALLFLDDRPENVAGALAAGLCAEVYSRQEGSARLADILGRHGW